MALTAGCSDLGMKLGDLFLVHVGLSVHAALVAELLSERHIISNMTEEHGNNITAPIE